MLNKEFAKLTNGYFSLKTATDSGITRWQLQELLNSGEIQKVRYDLYITQLLCPKAIYLHETALFFTGYSDQKPFTYTVAVPHGFVSKTLAAQYKVKHVELKTADE